MENNQTAVEWLKGNLPSLFQDDSGHYQKLFDQAKEMEKGQLWRIYLHGWTKRERLDDLVPDTIYPEGLDYEEKQEYDFEKYYEEAYG
jgi:hypothetical protein